MQRKAQVDDQGVVFFSEGMSSFTPEDFDNIQNTINQEGGDRLIIDIKNGPIPVSKVRQEITDLMKNPNIKRIALIGANEAQVVLGKVIFKVAGFSKYKFLDTYDEAYKWVTEDEG